MPPGIKINLDIIRCKKYIGAIGVVIAYKNHWFAVKKVSNNANTLSFNI